MDKKIESIQERVNQCMEKDKTHKRDSERISLFYILAGNDDLYSKINYIYDFKERIIKSECLESGDVDFSSSSQRLIKLAFNLYNGYPADVLDTFIGLDEDNFKLALNSLVVRFRF